MNDKVPESKPSAANISTWKIESARVFRIFLLGTLLTTSSSGQLHADTSELPPTNAFNLMEMKDPSTLDLKILADELVPASKMNAGKVRLIQLEFFSQNWGGEEVRHLAKVYLPANGIAESKRGMAIINQGGSSNAADGFDLEKEYGSLTTLKLGIPSMLLQSNMPGDHWGVIGQGPVRRYTAAKFFETGDPNWIHWIALAKIYMRAMTVLGELEDVQATQFVLAGSSKRAQSIWIAAAVDDRIRGIVSIARPGNFLHLIQTHSPSPGKLPNPDGARKIHEGWKHEYMAHIEDMYTTRGYEYMAYIDPYQFLSRVKVPVMYLIGTNDNLFNSFDDHGFYPFYEGDKSFAYVPNYLHGMGTSTHVQAYRAWAAHCFWGRPVTTVAALESEEHGTLNISAIVNSQANVTGVRLYYCFLQGKKFNDAKDSYLSVPMKQGAGTSLWNATLPSSETSGREVYWYVETRDQAQGLESIATTLLKRSRMPSK
ncbi:MAG: PhoPQ-activated protein PqaA family protein [Verrucomicrobia bacterium]|nr:PhoPQ-activated protein PqaA family protein [Verrucomicrobiota bacterium]